MRGQGAEVHQPKACSLIPLAQMYPRARVVQKGSLDVLCEPCPSNECDRVRYVGRGNQLKLPKLDCRFYPQAKIRYGESGHPRTSRGDVRCVAERRADHVQHEHISSNLSRSDRFYPDDSDLPCSRLLHCKHASSKCAARTWPRARSSPAYKVDAAQQPDGARRDVEEMSLCSRNVSRFHC